ncbi:nitrogenase [Nostocaceae cyanobacterium CENA369]|uniref:Nitrogenase n=1 Tax=Dendronalium phyllosphericum CENA369 TaxID=1725256 RepID=A0A8J7LJ33_9NOST|nr:Mo-dependent nitrogenase C-terminal domain-containing protein [Dendronalium phyllosphericum]MBH8575334.1 nitrogenase [Dendronalium phyllosphericum CENA369]
MLIKTQAIAYYNLLDYLRQKLDSIEITNPKVAQFFCWLIPSCCPFERTIKVFERPILYIPPLCKLNPLYEQLVSIRFRSLNYLANQSTEI